MPLAHAVSNTNPVAYSRRHAPRRAVRSPGDPRILDCGVTIGSNRPRVPLARLLLRYGPLWPSRDFLKLSRARSSETGHAPSSAGDSLLSEPHGGLIGRQLFRLPTPAVLSMTKRLSA